MLETARDVETAKTSRKVKNLLEILKTDKAASKAKTAIISRNSKTMLKKIEICLIFSKVFKPKNYIICLNSLIFSNIPKSSRNATTEREFTKLYLFFFFFQ